VFVVDESLPDILRDLGLILRVLACRGFLTSDSGSHAGANQY